MEVVATQAAAATEAALVAAAVVAADGAGVTTPFRLSSTVALTIAPRRWSGLSSPGTATATNTSRVRE